MKVYNCGKLERIGGLIGLIWLTYFLILDLLGVREAWSGFFGLPIARIGIPLAWLIFILTIRDVFCPFIIDEKGITSKVPLRNIFIPWSEIKYIRVGELHRGMYYAFTLCFSKIPLKKVNFWQITKNNKRHLFIRYRVGMLEEVLKYVDEERIQDVERIKGCPNPHKFQKRSNSMKEQERYNSLEILEPKQMATDQEKKE